MIDVKDCDCGAPHKWIVWRGYQLGPLAPAVADQIMQVFGGMREQIMEEVESNPLAKMVLGAVLTLPPAIECSPDNPGLPQ